MPSLASSAASGILFVNLKMEADEGDEIVNLINTRWVDGSLKPENAKSYRSTLECEFLTDDNDVIKTVIIEHPLYKSVEVYDPVKPLERREVALEEAYFSIRVELTKNATYLRISDPNKGELVKLKL